MLGQSTSASCLRSISAVRIVSRRSFASGAARATVQVTQKITTRITTSKIVMRAEVAANAGRSFREAVIGKGGPGRENQPGFDHRMEGEKLKDEGMAAGGASRSRAEQSN